MQRFIENEYDRKMLLRFIESEKLPFSVSTAQGGKRSLKQNRLQRLWLNEIAEQKGDMKVEEVRAYCKLTIGVPILRAENEEFRDKYDEVVKPLPYELKMKLMQEPLDFPVTRLMTTRQHANYLDSIQRHFAEQGIELTSPDLFGLNFRDAPSADNDAGAAEPIASPLGSATNSPAAPAGDAASDVPNPDQSPVAGGPPSSGLPRPDDRADTASPSSRGVGASAYARASRG